MEVNFFFFCETFGFAQNFATRVAKSNWTLAVTCLAGLHRSCHFYHDFPIFTFFVIIMLTNLSPLEHCIPLHRNDNYSGDGMEFGRHLALQTGRFADALLARR